MEEIVMNYKSVLANVLYEELRDHLVKEDIMKMIEKPKFDHQGDLAFPCFELAKVFRKSPQLIASELSAQIEGELFEKVESVAGYLNVFLNKEIVSEQVIKDIMDQKSNYGDLDMGNGGVITIDFSSPNIAKPFSMGHLRSTVIGNAISLIAEKCGYNPVRINHLGDWGTQFGKLIMAYKKWGNEEKVKEQPIRELLKLYIKFHEEAEKDPVLNDQGREWFKKLEDGNSEAISLWKWFREESLKEFDKIYAQLGISFDSYHGEAFYNDKKSDVVKMLEEQQLLVESEGAKVVSLEEKGYPPCLIKKKDGTTLYATRDLAAAQYRYITYHFSKSLYVVGNEQSLHFQQVIAVLEKMGFSWAKNMKHIPFGMILKDGKKMSTRKGKLILLEGVLKEATSMAMKNILGKNPNLQEKEEVAKQVGAGALIFHDLKHYRLNDVEFSLEDMLKFEGDTGPYVQYSHARATSILKKGDFKEDYLPQNFKETEKSWSLIKQLTQFQDTVKQSFDDYDPSLIAKYLLDLSKTFNKYYATVRILEEDKGKQERLSLVYSVKLVLKEGLRLLGVKAPEEM